LTPDLVFVSRRAHVGSPESTSEQVDSFLQSARSRQLQKTGQNNLKHLVRKDKMKCCACDAAWKQNAVSGVRHQWSASDENVIE
jgi:hypothetical protein